MWETNHIRMSLYIALRVLIAALLKLVRAWTDENQ